MRYQLNIDWQNFLSQYWQKKPLLIKNAFKNFSDPISPEVLAGLAMESEIDSRIVTNHKNKWTLEHGPFEDFQLLTETHSTLLVQAVNHWHEEAAQLIEPFRYLPDWRLDDLMVSYSTPEGGVGPHVDQYDVFILQGMGKRHWKVGEIQTVNTTTPHPQLLQVEGFTPCIDVILEPGDLLYIPPLAPHEGYAIEPSLNYSIGFRAPNARELISGFADFVIAQQLGSKRYYDHIAFPSMENIHRPINHAVQTNEITAIRQLMTDLLSDEKQFTLFVGEFLSQSRHELNLSDEGTLELEDILEISSDGEVLQKLSGLRILSINESIFINGDVFTITNSTLNDCVLNGRDIDASIIESLRADEAAMAQLITLVNLGYWNFIPSE